jgi:hypothetical protein
MRRIPESLRTAGHPISERGFEAGVTIFRLPIMAEPPVSGLRTDKSRADASMTSSQTFALFLRPFRR